VLQTSLQQAAIDRWLQHGTRCTVASFRFWPVSDGLTSTVAIHGQTSVCSAISKASSTSIPRYRTVLSSFVWPSRS
jgi:hypothetical protein